MQRKLTEKESLEITRVSFPFSPLEVQSIQGNNPLSTFAINFYNKIVKDFFLKVRF